MAKDKAQTVEQSKASAAEGEARRAGAAAARGEAVGPLGPAPAGGPAQMGRWPGSAAARRQAPDRRRRGRRVTAPTPPTTDLDERMMARALELAREAADEAVTWRRYCTRKQTSMPFAEYAALLQSMRAERTMDNFDEARLPQV